MSNRAIGDTIPVLDNGFVRLDDCMADDLSVVNSARVSFAQRSEYEWSDEPDEPGGERLWRPEPRLKEADAKLINFLMKNRHGTPFEHNAFRFHIKAPLFVFREWQRHRISSYNEWSARYSELKNEFYVPEVLRTQVGKPGEYSFKELKDGNSETILEMMVAHNQRAFDQYRVAMAMGVAKEQARLFLPVSIYSEMYWTVNARSLMNFLSLRNSDQAMWEIMRYAKAVEELFERKMPVTARTFVDNGRIAP